jgi:hypothetical protein
VDDRNKCAGLQPTTTIGNITGVKIIQDIHSNGRICGDTPAFLHGVSAPIRQRRDVAITRWNKIPNLSHGISGR